MLNRLTIKSRNKKTGPIPVTTTERGSCPKSCPFKKNGCYADSGPLALIWDQVNTGLGQSWDKLCKQIAGFDSGTMYRHNQAGDLPHIKETIDSKKVKKLVEANAGKKGFTYTHHDMTKAKNRSIVKYANNHGFTINLSANNLKHADKLKALDIGPVAVVLPIDQVTNTTTPKGHKVTVCPATVDKTDKINCKNCKLCTIANRSTIIGFPAHGNSKNIASNIADNGWLS